MYYPTPEPTPLPLLDRKDDEPVSSNMTTTSTFHQFPLLPPELRNIIWDLSLPAPVVYDIYPASSTQTTPPEQGLRFGHPFSEPPPALAAVCRESRSLALHRYRPLTLDGTTKYVDLHQDFLLLESSLYSMHLFRTLYFMGNIPLIRENLQSLAFGTSYGVHTGLCHPVLGWQKLTRNNMGRFLQRLTALKRLKKLIFVVHQEAQFAMRELPPLEESERYARDGQVVLNATLYSKGSTPPPPRVLAGRQIDVALEEGQARLTPLSKRTSSASKSEMAATAEDCHFRRVPWTGQKPGVPHVNELYFYPEDSEEASRLKPTKSSPFGQYDASSPPPPHSTIPPARLRGAVPADEDWQRFKKTIKHDLETGLRLGLAEKRVKGRPSRSNKKRRHAEEEDEARGPQRKRPCVSKLTATTTTTTTVATSIGDREERSSNTGSSRNNNNRWTIEGASLLWRYTMPSLPGF